MSRRVFIRFGISMVVGVLLISCSDTSSSNQPSGNTEIISHAAGETAVPKNPKRVVVLDYGALESAIALEIKPIGSTLSGPISEQPPYLQKELQGVQYLGQEAQANLERIAKLNPDLILGCQCTSGRVYQQLSKIAPTVLTETIVEEWQDNFLLYSQVLGKQKKAQDLFNQYQSQVKTLPVPENLTVSVARIFPSRVRLYFKHSFSGQILAQAGLNRPPSQDKDRYSLEIGKEQWQMLDADVLFVITAEKDAKTALETLKRDSLWSQLEVVQHNQVYQVPGYWVGVGILAAQQVIDDLKQYLPAKKSNKEY